MSPELHDFLIGIACLLYGGAVGYVIRRQRHANEVREWQAIARKAQRLNSLANTLKQERRANGSHEHAHQSDRDN